jgi:hypothetical protein
MDKKKRIRIRQILIVFAFLDFVRNVDQATVLFYGSEETAQSDQFTVITNVLYALSVNDFMTCALVLYMLIIEGIKDKDTYMLSTTRTIAENGIPTLNYHQHILSSLNETQELVNKLNCLFAHTIFLAFSFNFIMTPGTLSEVSKKDGVFKDILFWLHSDGSCTILTFLSVLTVACFVGSRRYEMKKIRQSLIRQLTKCPKLSSSIQILIDTLRQDTYKFTAVFFELDTNLVLSFVGSIITFTVLFLQLQGGAVNVNVPPSNSTSKPSK